MNSVENIRFYKKIKRGGDFKFFYEHLYDVIFSFNFSNENDLNIFLEKFLDNYIALTLKELNLKEALVFFDSDARTEKTNRIASSDGDKSIFLPCDIFKSSKNNIFFDMMAIAHELKHIAVNQNNKKIVRKINEISGKKIFPTRADILETFGFSHSDINVFYVLNEHEFYANQFGYGYVINLIDKTIERNKFLKKIDETLLRVYKTNIEYTRDLHNKEVEHNKDYYYNVLIPKVINKQYELFFKIKKDLSKFISLCSSNTQKLLETFMQLYSSFEIYHNEKLIEKIKEYILENYKNAPQIAILSMMILNIENYVATKQDYKNHIEIYKDLEIPVNFEELNLDKKNLIENYLDIDFNLNKNNCDINKILNSLEIDKIKTNTDLIKQLKNKNINKNFIN